MGIYLKGGNVFIKDTFEKQDVLLEGGRIADFIPSNRPIRSKDYHKKRIERVIDCDNSFLLPGLVDVHVHFREPGFEYKETIETGTLAAAAGGYTLVCTMPNLHPAPSGPAALDLQLAAIRRGARIPVLPFGTITAGGMGTGLLSDMEAMLSKAAGFSDDGNGVKDEETMKRAMERAASLGALIAAHCEDKEWVRAGNPGKGEWSQLARDLKLVRDLLMARDLKLTGESGFRYHACHLSTRQSLRLMAAAKGVGLPVTCETAPHYLLLSEKDREDDGRFRMNPPLGSEADRKALAAALASGLIDIIATDHAPHSAEEKSKGFEGSLNGVVGLETAFPVLYTNLVLTGQISMERLVDAMAVQPRKLLGKAGGALAVGEPADLALWDLRTPYVIRPEDFLGKGRSTPFSGWTVQGKNRLTIAEGRVAWERLK
jgi:dihydroorotase